MFSAQVDVDTYEQLFNANLRAPVFLSKYALPYLKISKGWYTELFNVDLYTLMSSPIYGHSCGDVSRYVKTLKSIL